MGGRPVICYKHHFVPSYFREVPSLGHFSTLSSAFSTNTLTMTQHITGHDIFGESLRGQLVLHCCVTEGSTTLTGYQTSSCHAASRRRAIQSPMQKYQAGMQKSHRLQQEESKAKRRSLIWREVGGQKLSSNYALKKKQAFHIPHRYHFNVGTLRHQRSPLEIERKKKENKNQNAPASPCPISQHPLQYNLRIQPLISRTGRLLPVHTPTRYLAFLEIFSGTATESKPPPRSNVGKVQFNCCFLCVEKNNTTGKVKAEPRERKK